LTIVLSIDLLASCSVTLGNNTLFSSQLRSIEETRRISGRPVNLLQQLSFHDFAHRPGDEHAYVAKLLQLLVFLWFSSSRDDVYCKIQVKSFLLWYRILMGRKKSEVPVFLDSRLRGNDSKVCNIK